MYAITTHLICSHQQRMGWCYLPHVPKYYQTHEKLILHLAMNPTSTITANLLTTLIIAWEYLVGGFLFVLWVVPQATYPLFSLRLRKTKSKQ